MKTLLLALLLCLPFLSTAQSVTLKPNIRPTGFALGEGDTLVVIGDNLDLSGSFDVKTNVALQKYSATTGRLLWEKKIAESRGTSSATVKRNSYGSAFLIDTRHFEFINQAWKSELKLIYAETNGHVLWERTYGELHKQAIKETPDRGFVITGAARSNTSTGIDSIFVMKIGQGGEEQWKQTVRNIGPNYGATAHDVLVTQDNGYLVVGAVRTSMVESILKDIIVIKYGANGNELWRKTINKGGDDVAWSIVQAANGDYIVGGYFQRADDEPTTVINTEAFAMRLSSSGKEVWTRTFGQTGRNETKYIEATEDGKIILITHAYDQLISINEASSKRLVLDAEGNIESEKEVFENQKLFHFETSPAQEVVVGHKLQRNELLVYRRSGNNCDIETSITASGALDLCPGQTVTLSAGEGFASYKWSTGQTTRTITVSEAGQYKVEVTNEIGCAFATEATTVTVQQPFAGDQICYVTVDRATGKNRITWNKTPDQNIASYNIYKRAVGGNVKVATVAFNDPATALDNTSQPDSRTEYYFIKAVDKCGNESVASTEHRTVLLQASIGTAGEVNLNWNRYTGATALRTIIYRGRSHDALAPIAELTSQEDRYIDRSPVAEEKLYQIGIELDVNCSTSIPNARESATMASVLARSNAVNLLVAGLEDDYESGSRLITIWPNPMADKALITIDPNQPKPASLQIIDVTGRFVRQEAVADHTIILRKHHLPAGFYIIAVTLENGYTLKKKVSLK